MAKHMLGEKTHEDRHVRQTRGRLCVSERVGRCQASTNGVEVGEGVARWPAFDQLLTLLKTPASLFAKPLSLFVSVPNFGDQNFAFL